MKKIENVFYVGRTCEMVGCECKSLDCRTCNVPMWNDEIKNKAREISNPPQVTVPDMTVVKPPVEAKEPLKQEVQPVIEDKPVNAEETTQEEVKESPKGKPKKPKDESSEPEVIPVAE